MPCSREITQMEVSELFRRSILGQHIDPNYYVGDTYADEIVWLRAWVLDRAEWLDGAIPGVCP